jgi:adenylate cyclase
LFADVRGSTGLGERLSPTAFHAFLSRFYDIGSATILAHDGLVDKLVGDEIIGLFFGGVSGPAHAKAAIEAGVELLERAGRADARPKGRSRSGRASTPGSPTSGRPGPRAPSRTSRHSATWSTRPPASRRRPGRASCS